ncbi:MAG: sulfurtransferase TusA family protein [Thermodesulfovibrionales bacterium]|nr:sulfurtransferase TusA family protein [Thermodesulfovibrionales bacterium]
MLKNIDVTLDLIGLRCPGPVLKTKKAIDIMQSGQTVLIICDDGGAVDDIPALCRRVGCKVIDFSEENGMLKFIIEKQA